MLSSKKIVYADREEIFRGNRVYTSVSILSKTSDMYLWIKGVPVENVGVIAEIKVIHSTEESAMADGFLAEIMEELQKEF